ncbi:MAG TPA: tRNA 2-thiouridine(34) synthase MnmA [Candidatus Bathyarchaeia archaeon]|nr:tRNA 2-thiouridine(34) synthase MnmA [Candidatus Bathyarchaeia archaeon]
MKSQKEQHSFSASVGRYEPGSGTRPIAVLMSGGVDSSVTAMLLRDAGWDVVGVTMKLPVLGGDPFRRCCGTDAPSVCRDLGVPHFFLDVAASFLECVVAPFREGYASGATPSPCVDCNTHFKFGTVWNRIREDLRIEHLATGHYVQVVHAGERDVLRRAADLSRDQSYFLYGLPRERLAYLECPLGERTKDEVRRLAAASGLPVAEKADSMELCFAGEGDYRDVLEGLPARPGPVCDTSGNVLGRHQGIHRYTVGQRRGLPASTTGPLYVLRIVPETNTLVVGGRAAGMAERVGARHINVLVPERFGPGERLAGKIRSVGEPSPCELVRTGEDEFEVRFEVPVFAPAPGQHLVLYDKEGTVVAGGAIF